MSFQDKTDGQSKKVVRVVHQRSDTQADAINYGRSQAKKESGQLYVHRKDGTIREHDSYGDDPNPPKNR